MINLQKVAKVLEEQQLVEEKRNTQVFAVWWSNGEPYREDEERRILKMFSTMENAEVYRDKWIDDYKNKCEAIATEDNYQQYADYKFEFYFPETVWIVFYVLDDAL